MLKKRLIAALTIKNNWVVQSVLFERYLPIGQIDISVEALNRWGIDEIVILDIDASKENRPPNFDALKKAATKAFVPIAFGGGLKTIDAMNFAIHLGADKIILNSQAVKDPNLITQAAKILGNQCVIVSIDVKRNSQQIYEVMIEGGRTSTNLNVIDWIQEAERRGAGEILLNSIDRDGTKSGFELPLYQAVHKLVKIPIIGCGGAGHPEHFLRIYQDTELSAACAGNYFHFTEQSPIVTKSYLLQKGIQVRLDTDAAFCDAEFDVAGRVTKWPEQYLRELRYKVIHEEKI